MTEGELILHDAIIRAFSSVTLLQSMRRVMAAGSWEAEVHLRASGEKAFRMLTQRPELLKAFKISATTFDESELSRLAGASARDDVASAFAIMTASELAFYHSLADDVAWDCCRAIATIAPEALSFGISQRKASLEELDRVGLEQIRLRYVGEYVAKLRREGLITKTSLIMTICRPSLSGRIIEGYRFNGRRLKRLDRLRHDLIHGLQVELLSTLQDGDMTFLSSTPMYLAEVVAKNFGIEFDTEYTAPRIHEMLANVPKRARVNAKW